MNLLDKEPVKRAEKELKKFNKLIKIVVLKKSARTAADAANALKCEIGSIVKSLLFRTENTFILCLVKKKKKCSLSKLKRLTSKKDISIATPEEVKIQTGYTIGGVSPVGHSNKLEILIDKSLERFTTLFAAAGHPNCIFKINFNDLQKITNGVIVEITE